MAKHKEAAVTLEDIQAAADRGRQRDRDRIAQLMHTPEIITDERMPRDAVALVGSSGDVVLAIGGKVGTLEELAAEFGVRLDCTLVHGCQLSHGHPLPHCCVWPSRPGVYLMCDAAGLVLREI